MDNSYSELCELQSECYLLDLDSSIKLTNLITNGASNIEVAIFLLEVIRDNMVGPACG